MKVNEIKYYKTQNNDLEYVYSSNMDLSFPKHNHISIYTIGLVLQGTIILERKESKYKCIEDDLFIISPYEPHSIEPLNGRYTLLSLCINKKVIKNSNLEEVIHAIKSTSEKLVENGVIDDSRMLAITEAVGVVFGEFWDYENDKNEIILQTSAIIEENPETEFKLDEMSQSIFISKYYFIREFKKNIGLSPHNFQIQNRIRKAQQFLAEGKTIVETAADTGFYDQSHFVKYFKKIVGMTPSEYIDSIQHMMD